MSAVAIRLSPGAARALAAGGRGVVEIALRPGGYVRLGRERWLLVAPERAPLGPLSVLVRGLRPLHAGASVVHAGAALDVGDLRIELRGAPVDGPVAPAPLCGGWRLALDAALAECASPQAELAAGLEALREGAAGGLAGVGPGLTPAGDDVLAGYAAWRHADGAPAALSSERCSPLGGAYLRCAERGELPDVASRVLHAIRAGDVRLAAQRARALRGWGATSGSAILWGMAAAAGTRA